MARGVVVQSPDPEAHVKNASPKKNKIYKNTYVVSLKKLLMKLQLDACKYNEFKNLKGLCHGF